MRSTLLRLKTPPYVYLLDMWMQIPGLYPNTPISFYNQRNAPYCRMVAFLKILLFIANHEFLKEKRCFPTFLHACFFSHDGWAKKKRYNRCLPFSDKFGGQKSASQKKNPTNKKMKIQWGFSWRVCCFCRIRNHKKKTVAPKKKVCHVFVLKNSYPPVT